MHGITNIGWCIGFSKVFEKLFYYINSAKTNCAKLQKRMRQWPSSLYLIEEPFSSIGSNTVKDTQRSRKCTKLSIEKEYWE